MRSCLVIRIAVFAMLPGLPLRAAEPAKPSESLSTTPDSTSTESMPSATSPPEQPAAATPPMPEPPASSLQDICKIDPSACPKVDIQREQLPASDAAIYALQQSGPPGLSLHGDIGSKADSHFVMRSGYAEVRGELAFITSDAIVTPARLRFGDITLFRPSVRRAFGDKLELSLGTTLLAKEPTAMHDWVWQGASLRATIEPFPGYAFVLEGRGGPMLDGMGSVWSAASGLSAKWSLDHHTRVLVSLANLFTALDEKGRMAARAWLDEVVFGGEVQFGDHNAGAWVGFNYAIPVAKSGNLPNSPTPIALKPTVRIDLQVGGVLHVGRREDWDLFAFYAWIDRGEMGRPETLLPVLDGGFDQQQIVLGIGHRFAPGLKRGDDDAAFSR